MCGIFSAVFSNKRNIKKTTLCSILLKGINELQHRGYDGFGISIEINKKIKIFKSLGMVKDGMDQMINKINNEIKNEMKNEIIKELEREMHEQYVKIYSQDEYKHDELAKIHNILANKNKTDNDIAYIGLGHVRYKTVGINDYSSTQPLLKDGICLSHNGQIEAPINCKPDSEHILNFIHQRLFNTINTTFDEISEKIFNIIGELFKTIVGSYSCLMLVENVGLVAFRDPKGIRPLIIGKTTNGDYVVASESVSHYEILRTLNENKNDNEKTIDWEYIRDVKPGECIIIDRTGEKCNSRVLINEKMNEMTPCIFEYIYLSDERSIMDGLPVKRAREELGRLLGKHIKNKYNEIYNGITMVIPIPESSCIAARALAEELGIKYNNLLELNTQRKKARSFILPTQEERVEAVTNKFIIPNKYDFKGQNILLVDDSIVRGTTLRYIIQEIKEKCINYGKINVASIAPAIRHQNIYGIDIPDTELLLAYQKTDEEVAKLLNVDVVIYQDLNEMLELFKHISPFAKNFEHSMFIQ